jgi:Calcineurin-like phosphoesterase
MQVIAIHLSDIHIDTKSDPVLSRASLIVRSAHSVEPEADAVFILFTGDITYSGSIQQFDVATGFIEQVVMEAKSRWKNAKVAVFLCPGNHDCDFAGSQSVRDAVLPGARSGDAVLDAEILQVCCQPLRNYYNFSSSFGCPEPATSTIYTSYTLSIAGCDFDIRQYNTAWASKKHETQGQLLMPAQWLPSHESQASVVISLFHHPYNWLEGSNARQFREHIEQSSDLVFTGHEHDADMYTRTNAFYESNADYYEGACLQSSSGVAESAFNVVAIDTGAARRRFHAIKWNGALYAATSENPIEKPFVRNEGRARREFAIRAQYYSDLTSPGASFTHPRKSPLTMLDLFVHPHLRELSGDPAQQGLKPNFLDAEKFWEAVKSNSKMAILGDDASGKTTLARYLYLRLHESGEVPLLVNAPAFSQTTTERVHRAIRSQFNAQYNSQAFEAYRQLDRIKRTLIVDKLNEVELNANAVSKLIRVLEEFFGRVIVISNSILLISEMAFEGGDDMPLRDYSKFQLLEFGNELREALIEKWLSIGREETIHREQFERETIHAKTLIDSVLGKNLIPSCPLFVLVLMQQIETFTNMTTTNASEGYLYEVLITRSLQRSTGSVAIDTAYTYLSAVANAMFDLGRQYLTEVELEQLHQQYCKAYDLDLTFEVIERALIQADLLKHIENRYWFRYGYCYFYFFARHLRDRLNSTEGVERVNRLVEEIHRDDSASILAFLTYLAKDSIVIEAIRAKAKGIYADAAPATLEDDSAFFGGLLAEIPKRVYSDRPAKESRREINRALDRANGNTSKSTDKEVDDTLRLNVAFKTLQILGQVIRNFPGSLLAEQKAEIAEECYLLGLRSMSMILRSLGQNAEALVATITEHIFGSNERPKELTKERTEKAVRRFLAWIINLFAASVVKRISGAVGSETLRKTFEAVRVKGNTTAFDLIDISIKLDHFARFPEEEITEFVRTSGEMALAMQVLRDLIVMHFYRFPRDFRVKQRCCVEVGLEYKAIARLEQMK